MSSSGRVTYTSRPDITPELKAAVLATVYRYILDCHAKKNAAEAGGGEDSVEGGDEERGLNDAVTNSG